MKRSMDQRTQIDGILNDNGYRDYRWIDPGQIVVAQWLRMKCMFGFEINVRTDYDPKMDRFAFLMLQ
jgi:hypothetical protein